MSDASVEVFPVNPEFDASDTVVGKRIEVPLPAVDARTHALKEFAKFLSLLRFNRPGKKGGSLEAFCINLKNIHIDEPDNIENLRFPAIGFLPARAQYETFGLGPARLDEATKDVFAPGTALLQIAEYREVVIMEVWATKIPERRAIVAGLETVLGSFENSWALTLLLPDYFNRTATFALNERQNIDTDAVRNRRRAHFFIDLTVNVVKLVNINTLIPYAVVDCE